MFEQLMGYVPVAMLVLMFVLPYAILTNETYKAIYKVKKVPMGEYLMNYIPLFNNSQVRKYLYGGIMPDAVFSIGALLCLAFRLLAIELWGETRPDLILVSVFVAIAGVVLLWISFAWTSLYTALLTRRGVVVILLSICVPPVSAYIVGKNMRRYMASVSEELSNDFSGSSK